MPTQRDATPRQPSAEDSIRRLAVQCRAAAPFPPLPNERFDAAHEAYERSSCQQREVLQTLRRLAAGAHLPDEPLRVLSVGPGNGMLDLPLLESLAAARIATDYVGVEPSRVAATRFRDAFRAIDPPAASLTVHECGVDELPDSEAFDLIHAVHSLYYVPDPPTTLARLLGRLKPHGRLVVFQAPRGALNALSECFWRDDAGRSVWFSDRLEAWLTESGRPFEKQRIDARLDATAALDLADPAGRLVLDFVLHTPSEALDAATAQFAIEHLRAISQHEGDRWLTPHPVDAFVIAPDGRPC